MDRNLAYWKSRKIDIRNCLKKTTPGSTWYADLCHALRFAGKKIRAIESTILHQEQG